ncbi:hypothetical protein YC2023_103624 [Brassica napus]
MDGQKWSLGFISLAFLFITCSSAELLIQQVTGGRGTEINSSYSLEANLGVTRVFRDGRPSSKILTIAGYSVIKGRPEYYESSAFEAADGAVKRFNAAKKEWGYGQLISLATFQNTNQGYIVQNACSFGAEIFIVKPAEQQEKVTFISNPPNNVFTWKVLRFSSLEDKFYYSDEFLVGDKILGLTRKGMEMADHMHFQYTYMLKALGQTQLLQPLGERLIYD